MDWILVANDMDKWLFIKIDLKEIVWEVVDWILVANDMDKWLLFWTR